jgi:hypothetical protein
MAEFASKGVAGSGLGLGIAGTALGVLNGGLGNILGGSHANGCSENNLINRYELELENKIVSKDSEIALLKSNIYTDQKIAEVYERLNTKIGVVEAGINAQAVYNAANTATIGCIQGQVAQLFGLTKLVVPNTSVCPGWGNVTITPATTPTTGA